MTAKLTYTNYNYILTKYIESYYSNKNEAQIYYEYLISQNLNEDPFKFFNLEKIVIDNCKLEFIIYFFHYSINYTINRCNYFDNVDWIFSISNETYNLLIDIHKNNLFPKINEFIFGIIMFKYESFSNYFSDKLTSDTFNDILYETKKYPDTYIVKTNNNWNLVFDYSPSKIRFEFKNIYNFEENEHIYKLNLIDYSNILIISTNKRIICLNKNYPAESIDLYMSTKYSYNIYGKTIIYCDNGIFRGYDITKQKLFQLNLDGNLGPKKNIFRMIGNKIYFLTEIGLKVCSYNCETIIQESILTITNISQFLGKQKLETHQLEVINDHLILCLNNKLFLFRNPIKNSLSDKHTILIHTRNIKYCYCIKNFIVIKTKTKEISLMEMDNLAQIKKINLELENYRIINLNVNINYETNNLNYFIRLNHHGNNTVLNYNLYKMDDRPYLDNDIRYSYYPNYSRNNRSYIETDPNKILVDTDNKFCEEMRNYLKILR